MNRIYGLSGSVAMKQAPALAALSEPRTESWESMLYHNQILAALPPTAQQRVFPHLKLILLPLGTVLKQPGRGFNQVYFPVDSILSLRRVTEDGVSPGVLLVGNEGVLGVAVCMGGDDGQNRAIVQSAGYAFGLSPRLLKDQFDNHSDVRKVVLRYTQALMAELGQTAVCNRHHSIDQQLCRWLLLFCDRLQSNCLTLTQERMATLIGVRRESVTGAAGKLKKLGVIECQRGNMTVIDRAQLERLACECYEVVRKETECLMNCQGPVPLLNRVG